MNVLFVIDPLATLQADIDATVGLMTAAQQEGLAVWTCQPEDLWVRDGRVRCRAVSLRLRRRTAGADHRWRIEQPWFDEADRAVLDVAADTDLVLLRIDPPVDARYLHTTYLLDLVESAGVPVVNSPSGIRAVQEKLHALHVPDLCPATLVSASPRDIVAFVDRTGTCVVKPVDGFAGMDVWRLEPGADTASLADSATGRGTRHVIVQQYLPQIAAGNKRLFVLDGQIIGAVLRQPSRDDFRIGPPSAAAGVEASDEQIVATLAPALARHGIAMAGIDVIGGKLIETNVTCPGGMHKADALLGTDLSGIIIRGLLERRPAV